jgi:hypothetical protein
VALIARAATTARAHLVPGNDDNRFRAVAEKINQSHPQWLVIWGLYSHRFWAFALFEMHPRMPVCAHYPDALITRMDEAERRYRITPDEVTSNDANSK